MSRTNTKTTPRMITVMCLDCNEEAKFPNKGFGRIGAGLFRQDHKCEAAS